MKQRIAALNLAAIVSMMTTVAQTADDPLKVCLDEDRPPFFSHHRGKRDDLLGALDRGDYDATLLDLGRFDAYRTAHPGTVLTASEYYYPVGAKRSYVMLASEPALLAAKALADLQAQDKIADFGEDAGLTYLPPREPVLLGNVWEKIIQR